MSIGILLLYLFKCFIRCLRVKVQLCTSFAYCRNGYKDHVMESFDESCVEGSVEPGSKDAILTDFSPGKEEGIISLRSFPDRQHQPPVAAACLPMKALTLTCWPQFGKIPRVLSLIYWPLWEPKLFGTWRSRN